MPIYEYTCKKCDTKFEKLIKSMSNGDKVPCPECHSTQTQRALSVFAVGAESPPERRRPRNLRPLQRPRPMHDAIASQQSVCGEAA